MSITRVVESPLLTLELGSTFPVISVVEVAKKALEELKKQTETLHVQIERLALKGRLEQQFLQIDLSIIERMIRIIERLFFQEPLLHRAIFPFLVRSPYDIQELIGYIKEKGERDKENLAASLFQPKEVMLSLLQQTCDKVDRQEHLLMNKKEQRELSLSFAHWFHHHAPPYDLKAKIEALKISPFSHLALLAIYAKELGEWEGALDLRDIALGQKVFPFYSQLEPNKKLTCEMVLHFDRALRFMEMVGTNASLWSKLLEEYRKAHLVVCEQLNNSLRTVGFHYFELVDDFFEVNTAEPKSLPIEKRVSWLILGGSITDVDTSLDERLEAFGFGEHLISDVNLEMDFFEKLVERLERGERMLIRALRKETYETCYLNLQEKLDNLIFHYERLIAFAKVGGFDDFSQLTLLDPNRLITYLETEGLGGKSPFTPATPSTFSMPTHSWNTRQKQYPLYQRIKSYR